MVSEQDFITVFRAYRDILEDPETQVSEVGSTLRDVVDENVEKLISKLPQAVQSPVRARIYAQLDKIEEDAIMHATERVTEVTDKVEELASAAGSAAGSVVIVEPINPKPNSPITVYFSGSSGDSNAWIGIYPAGAPHGEHHRNWLYVSGSQTPGEGKVSGEITFAEGWDIGDYEARLFKNNSHEMMATYSFSIAQPEPITGCTDPDALNYNSTAEVDDGSCKYLELEPEPEPEPEPELITGDLAALAAEVSEFRLNGERRRRIEAEASSSFLLELDVTKIERTMGIGLTDTFRGGQTVIGIVDGINVGVRLPNSLNDTHNVGQTAVLEARIIEYRAVTRRYEFEAFV